MAKKKKKIVRVKSITKTSEPVPTKLVVNDIRIQSANRNSKDIGELKTSVISAESVHYPNRSRLYDVFKQMTDFDGHLKGIMAKRESAVLNKKLIFETAADKKIDAMDDIIQSEAFREVIRKILQSEGWGLSGMQFVPGNEFTFVEIPRKHIKAHKQVISFEQEGDDGISYANRSDIWVIGKPDNLGYLLSCAPYSIWKFGNFGDWSQYIEVFGQPVRVIYYDAYDTKTKMELREVLDESGSSLALMIPKQAQFEMKDGKQSNGTGELQEKFKIACNEEMSVIVLGNTETTSSSKSSGYAQSKEHGKQQLEVTKDDMQFVVNMLNSEKFIRILRSYGLPVEGGRFKFEKEIDLEHLKVRMEIDEKLDSKVPLGEDYWYETYGVSKPANFDALMKKREAEKAALSKPAPGDPPKPKAKPLAKKLASVDGPTWTKLRKVLADFFDPAP